MKLTGRYSPAHAASWSQEQVSLGNEYFQLLTLLLAATLCVCDSVSYVYVKFETIKLNERILVKQEQLRTQQLINQEMRLEEMELSRYDRVKMVASKYYGLSSPKPGQYIQD